MKMQPDVEIFEEKDDVLNRNEFASRLAESIINYDLDDSLTIGILGSWGSGKSSLINLMENYLIDDYIIIRFKPWLFSNQDNLYLQFFKLIIHTLKNKNIDNLDIFESKITPKMRIFKKYDGYLKDYFDYIQDSSLDKNIDELFLYLNPDNLESYDSLRFHKKQCENYFDELGTKIIVIIDDIDRLMNTEIAQIFTLVKSLADFKHFIYILSFDKQIVTNALIKVNSDFNDKFIDKIIQIPINLPKISESKIEELIRTNIGSIYDEQLGKNFKDYNNNFYRILNYLKLFIEDMRDLKRYMNLLNFYKSHFNDELNIDDFFLILAIQLFEYDLFVEIKNSQEILTIDVDLFKNHDLITGRLTVHCETFKSNIGGNWDKYHDLLIFLFPILNIGNMPVNHKVYESWHIEHKICADKYFEKYFTLSLENNEANDLLVTELIKRNDMDEISEIFTRRSNLDYNYSLLSKFFENISNIPNNNFEVFIKALMKCGDEIRLNYASRSLIVQILDDLFGKIESEDNCFKLLKECLSYSNNVLTSSEIVYSITVDNSLFNNKSYISELKNLIVSKIRECSKNKDFLNMEYLQDILFYWKHFDDETQVKQYVESNVKADEDVLLFMAKFRTKSESPFYIIGNSHNSHLVFDLDELNTYHGLEFYEKVVNKKLNEKNIGEDIMEICQIFIKQYEEYKLIKWMES